MKTFSGDKKNEISSSFFTQRLHKLLLNVNNGIERNQISCFEYYGKVNNNKQECCDCDRDRKKKNETQHIHKWNENER